MLDWLLNQNPHLRRTRHSIFFAAFGVIVGLPALALLILFVGMMFGTDGWGP